MSPAAQHIALLEALGWRRFGMFSRVASGKQLLGSHGTFHGTPPRDRDKDEDEQTYEPCPVLSLDLIATAEATLKTPVQKADYARMLISIAWQSEQPSFGPLTASKEQRLEAYLHTTGRWV